LPKRLASKQSKNGWKGRDRRRREDLPMRLANMENKNRWKEREMKRPVEGGWGMNFCIVSQGTWQHVQT
jgi:hypothetical protein